MLTLTLSGYIKDGVFKFITKDHKKKQAEFAKKNNEKDFVITIEAVSKAEYYQHKFYRGILLPSIADCIGEKSLNYVHNFVVKKRFAFYPIEENNISKVPKKHQKGIIFLQEEREKFDSITGEITEYNVISGYLRSLSTFDSKEFQKFNDEVEHWLLTDLKHRILEELQNDYIETKKLMSSGLFADGGKIEDENKWSNQLAL
jgi:hypothetical protein